MADAINIGKIQADLEIDSGNVDRGLASARQAIQRMEKELAQLDQEFQRGSVSTRSYGKQVKELGDTIADLQQRMDAAYTATSRVNASINTTNKGMSDSDKATRMAGHGFMLLGQAVEDMQYGFAAVQNNIPGIVYSFTGSQGLAGAASLASVAIMTWARNWDHVTELTRGTTVFDTLTAGFERVQDAALSAGASFASLEGAIAGGKSFTSMEGLKGMGLGLAFGPLGAVIGNVMGAHDPQDALLKAQTVRDEAKKRQADEDRKKKGEAGLKALDKVGDEGDDTRQKAFADALKKFGGGERLRKMFETQLTQQFGDETQMAGPARAEVERKKAKPRTTFGVAVADALEGRVGAAEGLLDISPEFKELHRRAVRAQSPGQQERAKQAEEGMRIDEQERKQEERDADELADLQMEELEESNKNRQRQRQEQKRKRVENTRRAKEEAPGIETEALGFALQGMVAGLDKPETIDMVADQIRASLEEAGLTEKQAAAAAQDIAKEGVGAAEERVVKQQYTTERRKSATIGLEGLSEHIQAAVGPGDKRDKTNNYLDSAVKYLAKIAQKTDDRFVLRIEP